MKKLIVLFLIFNNIFPMESGTAPIQPIAERLEGYKQGLGVGISFLDNEEPEIPLIRRRKNIPASSAIPVDVPAPTQIPVLEIRPVSNSNNISNSQYDKMSNFFKSYYKFIFGGIALFCISYYAYKKLNKKKDYLKLFRESLTEDSRKEIKIILEKFDTILKNNDLQELIDFHNSPENCIFFNYNQSFYLKEFIKNKKK